MTFLGKSFYSESALYLLLDRQNQRQFEMDVNSLPKFRISSYFCLLWLTFLKGKILNSPLYRSKRKNGVRIFYEESCRDAQDLSSHLLTIGRDVTEQSFIFMCNF